MEFQSLHETTGINDFRNWKWMDHFTLQPYATAHGIVQLIPLIYVV